MILCLILDYLYLKNCCPFFDIKRDILSLPKSNSYCIKEEIGEQNYKVLQQIKQMTNQKGVQARMAYELKIN